MQISLFDIEYPMYISFRGLAHINELIHSLTHSFIQLFVRLFDRSFVHSVPDSYSEIQSHPGM